MDSRRRVLLLNPPGKDLYIRDYFCSKTTKSNYLFHPIDLLVLSGVFAERHDTAVLDAIAERLDAESALARVITARPDAIVSLVGAVSWEEDRAFLAAARAATGAEIHVIGDVAHDGGEAMMESESWVSGCFQSFANGDALALVEGATGTCSTRRCAAADASAARREANNTARTASRCRATTYSQRKDIPSPSRAAARSPPS